MRSATLAFAFFWLCGVFVDAQTTGKSARSELVPAGSINSVFSHKKVAIIAQDDAGIRRQATFVRDRFFKNAKILTDAQAVKADLAGHNLIVYGTVKGNAWLRKLRDWLPFR